MLGFFNGWLAHHIPYHPWSEYILWQVQYQLDISLLSAVGVIALILVSPLLIAAVRYRVVIAEYHRKIAERLDKWLD
jgi:hypothetical protein